MSPSRSSVVKKVLDRLLLSQRNAQRISPMCAGLGFGEWRVSYHLLCSDIVLPYQRHYPLPIITPSSTQSNGAQSNLRNHLAGPTVLLSVADCCCMCRGKCHLSYHPVVPSLSWFILRCYLLRLLIGRLAIILSFPNNLDSPFSTTHTIPLASLSNIYLPCRCIFFLL